VGVCVSVCVCTYEFEISFIFYSVSSCFVCHYCKDPLENEIVHLKGLSLK